jgi:hypothetical protein
MLSRWRGGTKRERACAAVGGRCWVALWAYFWWKWDLDGNGPLLLHLRCCLSFFFWYTAGSEVYMSLH